MFFKLSQGTLHDRERGSVALLACIFILFVSAFILSFLVGAVLHNRFIASHIEECRREYEREGVLVEAISLLEEKGKGFVVKDAPSVFAPSYTFTIVGDTITVKALKSEVLRAQIRWEGNRVVVILVENAFVRSFLR